MLGWARRLNLHPMCPLMCWLLSCGLCGFAVLADRWQAILGEFPGTCTQCPRSATTWPEANGHRYLLREMVQGKDKGSGERPVGAAGFTQNPLRRHATPHPVHTVLLPA